MYRLYQREGFNMASASDIARAIDCTCLVKADFDAPFSAENMAIRFRTPSPNYDIGHTGSREAYIVRVNS